MGEALEQQIGEAVRLLRRLRRLTLAELAQRSTLREDYLQKIERGEGDIGIRALSLLALGLDCSPHDLLPRGGGTALGLVDSESPDSSRESCPPALVFVLDAPEDSPGEKP